MSVNVKVNVNGRRKLEVAGFEAGVFGETGEHFGADLDAIVEGEDKIRILGMGQNLMGAGLAFELPTDGEKGLEDFSAFGRTPLAHAARLKTSETSGEGSPCSSRSARMRRTRASTLATASSRVVP